MPQVSPIFNRQFFSCISNSMKEKTVLFQKGRKVISFISSLSTHEYICALLLYLKISCSYTYFSLSIISKINEPIKGRLHSPTERSFQRYATRPIIPFELFEWVVKEWRGEWWPREISLEKMFSSTQKVNCMSIFSLSSYT